MPLAFAAAFSKKGNLLVGFGGNPWKEPPSDVVRVGLWAVVRYWQDGRNYGRSFSNRLKVVLVGLGSAGKTSLAIRLEGRDGDSLPGVDERTVGVEIRDIRLEPSPVSHVQHSGQDLAVKLWDFAGQRAYYDTHQIFLTQDTLYMLVVDMFRYRVEHDREEAIEQWLDIIQSRVPGAVVLLVGTHGDALANAGLCDKRIRELHQDVEDYESRLREERGARSERVRSSNSDRMLRVVNGNDVFVLDCKSAGEDEINRLRSLIASVAYNSDYFFPSVECKVPTPWVYAFLTLEAIRRGADLHGISGEIAAVVERLQRGDPEAAKYFVPYNDAFVRFIDLWKAMESGTSLFGITTSQEEAKDEASKYFLPFNDASGCFVGLWKAAMKSGTNLFDITTSQEEATTTSQEDATTTSQEEAEDVFLAAVGLNESQGLILLTNRDGSVDEEHDNRVSRSQVILHVDPVRFADVVRRIVDIRLVDSDNQSKIEDALMIFAGEAGVPFYPLSCQQKRFYMAGEVSKLYLKFLWQHREFGLGQATETCPPLKMTDAEVDAMVGSLVDLRMMFPVRNNSGGFEPDLYVVGACLPDHVGCKIKPETILQLNVGSALFRVVLGVHGSRRVPPGLIPRLLAWCGRRKAGIKACWRHGGCFTYKKHLVLIYACNSSVPRSSIVCCAKGDANNEEAEGILEDVAEEVDRLVRDLRYGFPGIMLRRDSNMEKIIVAKDYQLESLIQRLRKDLEDHMNLRVDDLKNRVGRIADGVNKNLRKELALVHAELGEMGGLAKRIESKIDFAAALAGKCLLLSAKNDCPCPRLIWAEEELSSAAQPQSVRRFGHFRRERWDRLLNLKKGKTSRTRFRVRFLCAHDFTRVACGADGEGYILEQKDWQRWLQKCLPVLQLSLWALRLGVSFIARADLLPVDDMLATLKEVVCEDVAEEIEALNLRPASGDEGQLISNLEKQVEVFGKAYEHLAKFVDKEEEKIAETTRVVDDPATGGKSSGTSASMAGNTALLGCQGQLARQSTTGITVPDGKRSFETEMVLAHRVGGGTGEVEWAWVRKDNKTAWETAEGSMGAGKRHS